MIRTQISVDEHLYEQVRKLAANQNISIAELCRRALAEVVAREQREAPWMAFAGILDGSPEDSESVDSVA